MSLQGEKRHTGQELMFSVMCVCSHLTFQPSVDQLKGCLCVCVFNKFFYKELQQSGEALFFTPHTERDSTVRAVSALPLFMCVMWCVCAERETEREHVCVRWHIYIYFKCAPFSHFQFVESVPA